MYGKRYTVHTVRIKAWPDYINIRSRAHSNKRYYQGQTRTFLND